MSQVSVEGPVSVGRNREVATNGLILKNTLRASSVLLVSKKNIQEEFGSSLVAWKCLMPSDDRQEESGSKSVPTEDQESV